jgi:hypothetical protein
MPVITQKRWLAVLALWAMVLTVETAMRPPGMLWGRPEPPQRLQLDGVSYERQPGGLSQRKSQTLPSSAMLVRHWVSNYRRVGAAGAPIRAGAAVDLQLAFIEAKGSGRANRLPVHRIRQWMADLDRDSGVKLEGVGGCLAMDPKGGVVLIENEAQWNQITNEGRKRGRMADPMKIPLWLAGLRGIEEVNCLWVRSEKQLAKKERSELLNLF